MRASSRPARLSLLIPTIYKHQNAESRFDIGPEYFQFSCLRKFRGFVVIAYGDVWCWLFLCLAFVSFSCSFVVIVVLGLSAGRV